MNRVKPLLKIYNMECNTSDESTSCENCEFKEMRENGVSRSCVEWQELSKEHCADVYNPNSGVPMELAGDEVSARVQQQIVNSYLGRAY